MIKVTRSDGKTIVLNAELIQYVEATPDTIITLTTDQKIIVKEKAEEIVKKVIEYKREIFSRPIGNL
ncbi:MAG: flagellar FlbD family protein [Candidatus Omnitrophota bacterium]